MRTQKSQAVTAASEFLTVADVRKYLKISQSAAYGLTHSKDFPVAHFGTSIRIPKDAFLVWVQSKTTIPPGVAEYLHAGS